MKYNKWIALLLATSMSLSLCACGTTPAPADAANGVASEGEEATEEAAASDEQGEDASQTSTTKEVEKPALGENLLANYNFDENTETTHWESFTYGGGAGSLSVKDGHLVVDIASCGNVDYGVQLYQDGFPLYQGCDYTMQFDAWSDMERPIEYRIQVNGGDYHAYTSEIVQLTTEPTTYTISFTMEEQYDPAPRLCFNMGIFDGMESGGHKIYYDNLSLTMDDNSNMEVIEVEEAYIPSIITDQVGYLPGDTKIAMFRGECVDKITDATTFEVHNAGDDSVLYSGTLSAPVFDPSSGEKVSYADFSAVIAQTDVYITSDVCEDSYTFRISDDVYSDSFRSIVQMMYLQRCGMDLDGELAGDFAHSACHTDLATIYGTEEKIDVSGGWHDAGDYGKYVVAGAKSVLDLLLTYENGEVTSDDLKIPESGNGVPDILDEAKYEIDWMLKMQDPVSGGVYHKVTTAAFPDLTMLPQNDKDELIVSPISVTATADFAAVMAHSYRLYADYNPTFADTCLSAGIRAYEYVLANLDARSFTNPTGISTGEYPDGSMRDERYLAAAELFESTGDTKYLDDCKAIVNNGIPTGLGWADMGYYGSFVYLMSDGTEEYDPELYKAIREAFLKDASIVAKDSEKSSYFISFTTVFPWGSNMSIANSGMLMLLANMVEVNLSYANSAKSHLHYLMGANPNGLCFVTGEGTASANHPHHRPSIALGKPMKGMLIGGADNALEDPFAAALLKDAAPAKCYVDNQESYSTNEITIYWNSPLIYLMSVAGNGAYVKED